MCNFYRASLLCKPCINYTVGMSVRLSARHTLALSENDASYHEIFTDREPKESTFRVRKFIQKFERVHPDRSKALNESRVGKIRTFQPISRGISDMVQDRTNVTIND